MARHLALIDEAVTDTITGRTESILVIEAPPRHGKSELICRYLPAWYLGTFPDRKVLLCMHSQSLADGYGRMARDLIDEHGPEIFGIRVRGDSSAVNDWGIEGHEGRMATAGVGTGIPGRGANLLIVDDPISGPEAAKSETQRTKQWDWWEGSAYRRMEPEGVVVLIATRWHEDDLSGRLIRRAATGEGPPVRRLHLPALATENDELGRQAGEALWPERWPREWLEMTRDTTSPAWWLAQYAQRPGRHEGTEWPETYFADQIWTDDFPREFEQSDIAIDPSKGKQHGDFSAIVFVGTSRGKIWVDASIERRPPERIVADAITAANYYRAESVALEANAFQDLLAPEFDRQCIERGIPPLPLVLVDQKTNKELRIGRIGPYLMRDNLRFRRGKGTGRLIQQLREFPLSEHDDGPDALELAIRELRRISQVNAAPPEDEVEYAF